jgi:crossover junction endodeoxyribonuclease RuvC
MRVTGLDLSLTGSGVVTVETAPVPGFPASAPASEAVQMSLAEYGSKPTTPDLAARGARLRSVATPVLRAARGSDLVVVEDLYMGSGTGGQLDRAGLFWLVVNSLTAAGIPVALATNNHLKMYALGKGGGKGTDKDYVLAAVIRRYPGAPVQSNNTADALVLAAMGARHLGCPIDPDLPESHTRAMKAVHWPSTTTR